jgi:hypothetical protein
MERLKGISTELPGHSLTFLGSTAYVYHCHHFNLFHDQTIDDALGEEQGFILKAWAAQNAAWQLLADLARATGAATPAERLELASSVFSWMGQGRLSIEADGSGGSTLGEPLHYSFAWKAKYGSRVRRLHPLDPFAAGFAAAATEVAFSLIPGSLNSRETQCYAQRHRACRFSLAANGGMHAPQPVDRRVIQEHVRPPAAGLEEGRISQIARGLADFFLGIEGDRRGLVQGFSVFLTRHLTSYYNETAYGAVHHYEKENPEFLPVLEALFGESGHACVFYAFGNLLLSPEWEALVGTPRNDVEEIIASCVAVARGLGFGHWVLQELEPDRRLVLRSTSNYEAPFYLHRFGRSDRGRCYFFAHAARALMQLAHRVDWESQPRLTDDLYQSLFKTGIQWHVEETRCLTCGDPYCEVVVTR